MPAPAPGERCSGYAGDAPENGTALRHADSVSTSWIRKDRVKTGVPPVTIELPDSAPVFDANNFAPAQRRIQILRCMLS